jgi:hypothetical protein
MNMTTRAVLRHFLLKLSTRCTELNTSPIDHFFTNFFTTDELKDIVHALYSGPVLAVYDTERMSKTELLGAIGSNGAILTYFLDRWDEETRELVALNIQAVHETLKQLGVYTHYLLCKDLSQWDRYDLSNYRALQVKAGRVVQVFGIYDSSIKQEEVNVVDTPPNRFYDSRELAQTAMQEMIEGGQFDPDELHILPLYMGR